MNKNMKGVKVLFLIVMILLVSLIIFKVVEKNNKQKLTIETVNNVDKLEDDHNSKNDLLSVFMYSNLSQENIEKIVGLSWKENSPVKLEELSYIRVTHWGFDDDVHVGELIVHEKLAQEILEIFNDLYKAKFPIAQIKLIDEYNADDDLSMSHNNSSAFCSREVTGKAGVFSKHSYGIAIDINPIQNPYVKDDTVLPAEGKVYLDRDSVRKGMIVEGDPCYNAFINRGWTWGGEWNSLKDYQHFEKKIEIDLHKICSRLYDGNDY